jgi:hypothetical protein
MKPLSEKRVTFLTRLEQWRIRYGAERYSKWLFLADVCLVVVVLAGVFWWR